MAKIIEMPRYGANMDEGTVATWFVSEGDEVKAGDAIAEIAIEKLSNELLAPSDGVILKLVAEEGDTLDCGATIAYIGEAGEEIPGAEAVSSAPIATQKEESSTPKATGDNMAKIIEMPRYGANMDEGTVATWFVSEGDEVKAGDAIAEIAIEKLSNELLAPCDGVILQLVAAEGDTLDCGATIAYIGEAGAEIPTEGSQNEVKETLVVEEVVVASAAPVVATKTEGSSKLTPKAQKLADELGIDASYLVGSGYFEMVTRDDVRKAYEAGAVTANEKKPVAISKDDSLRKPTEMEKMIAKGMQQSLISTAQATITMDMDVDNMVAYYASNKGRFKDEGLKLSYTSILLQIIGKALREHPIMRTVLDNGMLNEKGLVNLGVAIDIPGGLIVPNIKNADAKNLKDLSKELALLAEKSQKGTLGMDDLQNGTFTVTNLGMFGINYFTPVINPGESAILGLGAIREEVVVKDGGFRLGNKMSFSLTHDHQVINGAPAARFLQRIQELIKEL